MTSSLRGLSVVDVKVECGLTGYHSGEVGGMVPETFRIMRSLLNRIDNVDNGECHPEFQSGLPAWKAKEAEVLAAAQGPALYEKFALHPDVRMICQGSLEELYLNSSWRPNLAITGASGIPDIKKAGNVVRPATELRLSMRISPLVDCTFVGNKLVEMMTTNVPYGAKVTAKIVSGGNGWCQREPEEWLTKAINKAGKAFFGKPAASYGEGGSIPFLNELEGVYPQTQIIAFGVGGPYSNAHAPDEMLDLPYAKKLTCAIAHIIGACSVKPKKPDCASSC